MFEAAEIGHRLSKQEYQERQAELRTSLIQMQMRLASASFPVILIIAGDDRPGCDDAIKQLNTWLDARFMETNAFGPPSDEERQRPPLWRYWMAMPPKGRIGIFAGGWGMQLIRERLLKKIGKAKWFVQIGRIRDLEQMLADDGAIVLKFWLHLAKKQLKQRLNAAEKHPDRMFRIGPEDWVIYRDYDKGLAIVETFLEKTSTAAAPWRLVESADEHYRDVTIAQSLLNAVTARLNPEAAPSNRRLEEAALLTAPTASRREQGASAEHMASAAPTFVPPDHAAGAAAADPHTILDTLDLAQTLPDQQYEEELLRYQAKLHRLSRKLHQQPTSAILLFEGWDAGGKGGAIRRLVAAINAQMYRIIPIAAPTVEERRYHYLWRFWRPLPRAGRVLIFDRSWYGRVLVERVEGFASDDQWRRAYREINDFEEQLVDHGWYLGKFWLHISPEEQMRRFEERKATPFKEFKITAEDFRNREKWPQYEAAANDMVAYTSTGRAPWHLIAANDKKFARVEVLRIVCQGLEKLLKS